MSCERYATAIADHACGADLAPEAAAHLRTCPACAAYLAEQRRTIDGLDEELRELLAVEPSAYFVPRVQAHVAAEGAAERPRSFLVWSGIVAAVAVAVAAITVTVREPRSVRPAETAVTADAARVSAPPEPVAIERGGSASGADPVPAAPRRRLVAAPASTPAREPDVIVQPGQMQAVERYVAMLRSGRIDSSTLAQPVVQDLAPAELVLGPLAINPITVNDIDPATSSPSDDGANNTNKESVR